MAIATPPRPLVDTSDYRPQTDVGRLLKRLMNLPQLPVEDRLQLQEMVQRIIIVQSQLAITLYRGLDGTPWLHPRSPGYSLARARELGHSTYHPLLDPSDPLWWKLIEDYGVVSRKFITNAGINFLVGAFCNTATLSLFHWHGIGIGTNAESVLDVALQTELTTEYSPDNTRATGSQIDVVGTPHTYQTVGTNTIDSGAPAITEHMILTQAATGGGTGWDRSVFLPKNLNGAEQDSIQSTYTATLNAGG